MFSVGNDVGLDIASERAAIWMAERAEGLQRGITERPLYCPECFALHLVPLGQISSLTRIALDMQRLCSKIRSYAWCYNYIGDATSCSDGGVVFTKYHTAQLRVFASGNVEYVSTRARGRLDSHNTWHATSDGNEPAFGRACVDHAQLNKELRQVVSAIYDAFAQQQVCWPWKVQLSYINLQRYVCRAAASDCESSRFVIPIGSPVEIGEAGHLLEERSCCERKLMCHRNGWCW